jgi:hypothetical protein
MQSTFTEDQVLAIWKVITLLGEAEEWCEVVEHSAMLAEAETLLFDVLSKSARGGRREPKRIRVSSPHRDSMNSYDTWWNS